MTRPCASRTLLSSCLRGNAGSRCGEPWTPGEPTWPAQAFSSIAAMYPVLASATAPAISGALSTRPNVDGVAGRIQRSDYYHRVTPCGPEYRARRTPVRGGVCLRDGRQRWGSVHSGDEGPLVSGERPVLTQVRSMGPVDPVLPRVAPALAWTLISIRRQRSVGRPEGNRVTGVGELPHQP